eukprot:3779573-Rhodomonas_salina.1
MTFLLGCKRGENVANVTFSAGVGKAYGGEKDAFVTFLTWHRRREIRAYGEKDAFDDGTSPVEHAAAILRSLSTNDSIRLMVRKNNQLHALAKLVDPSGRLLPLAHTPSGTNTALWCA